MNFSKQNTLGGWIVFTIALIVYLLTLEPTVSLWDCGEFLVSAGKLEINHSPGSPLFMLLGRAFSLLSFGNKSLIAFCINTISAIASAATVMFLFWTISWLIGKIRSEGISSSVKLTASAIGALAFAFTDSFWFSAVEAEVYALSSLFSAAVLWAATKWEREADQPQASRWIVLIFFLIGLSIGVHLLNLLVIPSAALIYYFRKYPFSLKGFIITVLISGAGILALMMIFIPGILNLSKGLELFCVNQMHWPVNSGLFIYLFLIAALLSYGIIFSIKKKREHLQTLLTCIIFLLIGYSSYMTTLIRSAANPPVDQGNPETTFELLNYLNREQYGSRPILYGANFGSVPNKTTNRYSYYYEDGKYIQTELNPELHYDKNTVGLFPRMHSREPEHIEAYRQWTSLKGKKVVAENFQHEKTTTTIPTLSEQIEFFVYYQLGHMYLRYFMWNFVGKQNDVQGQGELTQGNWLSGISWIDSLRLGSQQNLPDEMKNNPGRNTYYFLPLLLGLIGLYFHYKNDLKNFGMLALLFLIMSIGLVVYLNEIPQTPRERDYVFVSSFYVFCIWIGLAIPAIHEWISKFFKNKMALVLTITFGVLAGPFILITQNYNDHDRSGRTSARDLARNYLESCEPNAILFTHADNDTYPLWYCQEIEGIRTDVRVVVMPYLSAGWYIEQLGRKVNQSEKIHFTIPTEKYKSNNTDYLYVVPKIQSEENLSDVLTFVASDSAGTKLNLSETESIDFIPVNKFRFPVRPGQYIPVELKEQAIMKGELAFWDILANNAGQRPVYFSSWTDPKQYGLEKYLRCDGLVYKLDTTLYEAQDVADMGRIDSNVIWKNLMEQCKWDNLQNPSVYFDWHHRRLFASMQIRGAFARLAEQLAQEGQLNKAAQAIETGKKTIPFSHWSVDFSSVRIAKLYFQLNRPDAAQAYCEQVAEQLRQWLNYYCSLDKRFAKRTAYDFRYKLYLFRELIEQTEGKCPKAWTEKANSDFMKYAENLQ